MKRLFLLIAVCMIGLVLPQGMWAGVTINTSTPGKVIVTSDNAGDFASYLVNETSDLSLLSKDEIVFVGNFNGSDLSTLQSKGYATQKKVDMSAAEFVGNFEGKSGYQQMEFKYWGANIEEAITSKKMTDSDQVPQMLCDGCSNLTVLTIGSGKFSGYESSLGNNVNSLTTVNVLKDVTSLSSNMFNGKTSITTVSFEDGEKNLAIGEGCFNGCTGITSLSLPARLASLGRQAFANTTGVTSLSFHENSKITTIPEEAFKSCGNATQAEFDITIPRSVTEIQRQAFGDMWRLKTVRFTGQQGDDPLVIETGAFAGGTESNYILSDVYVDINPQVRKLICEYGAFSYTSMEGQTNIEHLEELTTLHFNEKYWDYYAGDWKKGVTFDQAALNSFKDGCDTTKKPMNANNMIGDNNQIHANNGHIPGKQPANGWQQFAKTNTGIDIIVPKGKFYRTYSTPSALVRPDWMKIYRVKEFKDGFVEGTSIASSTEQANAAKKEAFTEELTPTVTGSDGKTYNIIPVNTGVIRVDNRDSEALYYILELERTSAANAYEQNASSLEYPYSKTGDKVNYMYPTNGDPATIGPVEKENGNIAYRIFGLLKVTQSGVIPAQTVGTDTYSTFNKRMDYVTKQCPTRSVNGRNIVDWNNPCVPYNDCRHEIKWVLDFMGNITNRYSHYQNANPNFLLSGDLLLEYNKSIRKIAYEAFFVSMKWYYGYMISKF